VLTAFVPVCFAEHVHDDVLADGKVVGRIPKEVAAGAAVVWSIDLNRPGSPATRGTAATFDEAKAKFRAAWESEAGRAAVTCLDIVGQSKSALILKKLPPHVRFRANRTLSRHRPRAEFDPQRTSAPLTERKCPRYLLTDLHRFDILDRVMHSIMF
jgi:hypothetical protein